MPSCLIRWCSFAVTTFLVCSVTADETKVDFQTHIRPILTRSCSACHGGVKQAGDISFVYKDQVLPPDGSIIEPGSPESSVLIERVRSTDADTQMPPPGDSRAPLSESEIHLLENWIKQGAIWDDHWSRDPLMDPLGKIKQHSTRWARRPLDRLVETRLTEEGLIPSHEAPPMEWLRRVSFDLTGLPPNVKDLDSFIDRLTVAEDQERIEQCYSDEVDRLLASEAFGERWASVWMDLARYADSKGFEKDPHRDMWPYRDWLIRAFNEDLPYDAFTIKQLAGDLLQHSEPEDLIATAFHRNTQTNTEGGTDDEEFRVAAVIDRINTTWTVWQATTFGCAQCHAHPYDPIRHDEYYAFMALLNNTADTDLDSDYPTLKIPPDINARDDAIAKQRYFQEQRHLRNQIGREIAIGDQWSALQPARVTSTDGNLHIVKDRIQRDDGTFPTGVTYTVISNAIAMTALRLEIFPESDDPSQWPEQGSLVTHVEVALTREGTADQTIELTDVFADAVTGDYDPRSVLTEKPHRGVGGYPKLHRPRWAVFVLKQPLRPTQNDQLKITMKHGASVTGSVATPTRNFRWSASNNHQWTDLLNTKKLQQATERLEAAKREVDKIQGAALPVLLSLPSDAARSTRKFIRGNWTERGDIISPAMPAAFSQYPDQFPTRLEMARWLVSDTNPLTARVWANRIWGQLFGRGLVETQEDFGASGAFPSHPDLLDHLALQIREVHNWKLKPFLRELVLSSTYRQTNTANETSRQRDPRNRLLSRGPRTRLSAEMIRDQALAVAGLLHQEIGGPSVMPPQPEGIWQTVYSGAKWKTATGPNRYRRGLYTYWRRTSPYPSFLMFDAPTRDICSARRITTNSPLQALVTLNDPVYFECAQGLAERAKTIASPKGSVEERRATAIKWMYRAATQRQLNPTDQVELASLYNDLSRETEPTPDKTESADLDADALSIVANTILNLDRALTK